MRPPRHHGYPLACPSPWTFRQRSVGVAGPLPAAIRAGLVVGLPLDSAGQPTAQAEHCRRYGMRLAQSLGLPLAWVNEHSSTWAAGERHGLQGDRTGRLDSAAAALLLEQWLQDGPALKPAQSMAAGTGAEPIDGGS